MEIVARVFKAQNTSGGAFSLVLVVVNSKQMIAGFAFIGTSHDRPSNHARYFVFVKQANIGVAGFYRRGKPRCFEKFSNIIFCLNASSFSSELDLNLFDVVITHYSLSLGPLMNHYLGSSLVCKLQYDGLKVALQDEYRAVNVFWEHLT